MTFRVIELTNNLIIKFILLFLEFSSSAKTGKTLSLSLKGSLSSEGFGIFILDHRFYTVLGHIFKSCNGYKVFVLLVHWCRCCENFSLLLILYIIVSTLKMKDHMLVRIALTKKHATIFLHKNDFTERHIQRWFLPIMQYRQEDY